MTLIFWNSLFLKSSLMLVLLIDRAGEMSLSRCHAPARPGDFRYSPVTQELHHANSPAQPLARRGSRVQGHWAERWLPSCPTQPLSAIFCLVSTSVGPSVSGSPSGPRRRSFIWRSSVSTTLAVASGRPGALSVCASVCISIQ